MKLLASLALAAAIVSGAPPAITELQPRGAQKGRPFTLTIVGQNLADGPSIVSSLPAAFTPLAPEKPGMANRYATFLVEPTSDWTVGLYPIRIKASNGVSNILLFSVGAFPEITEEESRPGSLPNQNDSIERAQSLPATPVTINGTLKGPERDFFRIQAKPGERRVFEVDARRAGSAIDPVIRLFDGAGKLIARSEDGDLLSLDARLDVTFAKEGFYYLELQDARFSTQAQNYYRLKTGAYAYPTDLFPLGGRRGEQVQVNLGAAKATVDLTKTAGPRSFVNLPDSPALPLPFAVGEHPEAVEPVTAPLTLPVTVNGRLSKPAEIDKYELAVQPGEEFIFSLQARELGTSKLTGLITVLDQQGKRLASAGDGPLPVDVAAVQASSRTLGDPYLQFKAPEGIHRITVTIEDLAKRGGPHFAYRLIAYRAPYDFSATLNTPFLNIPSEGTASVSVTVSRRCYVGPIRTVATNLPAGIVMAGGDIPAETADPLNKSAVRRGILTFTAAPGTALSLMDLGLKVIGTREDGTPIERIATGAGYVVPVAGATAQGVVDRQRGLTGEWLGFGLPVALTDAPPATLAIKLETTARKEAGYEFRYRWQWTTRDSMQRVPETVSVDVPNFIDLRVIEMSVDEKDPLTGTFLVTSTKNTLPALYNVGVSGRLMVGGSPQEIVAPVLPLEVPVLEAEGKTANASTAAAR